MATASVSATTSSLLLSPSKPTPPIKFRFRFRVRASSAMATQVAPAVIVGGGRVGRALQGMGSGDDLLVKRGDSVPLDFAGPILVCTRNDDLDAVLESTPKSRWSGTHHLTTPTLTSIV